MLDENTIYLPVCMSTGENRYSKCYFRPTVISTNCLNEFFSKLSLQATFHSVTHFLYSYFYLGFSFDWVKALSQRDQRMSMRSNRSHCFKSIPQSLPRSLFNFALFTFFQLKLESFRSFLPHWRFLFETNLPFELSSYKCKSSLACLNVQKNELALDQTM